MRVYLAGPMTGLPGHNFAAFEHWAKQLRLAGYDVVSPRELSGQTLEEALATPWEEHLRRDLRALLDCEAVVVLDGWARSRGALLEVETALRLGMPVYQTIRHGPDPEDLRLEGLDEATIAQVVEGAGRALDFERTLERITETVQTTVVEEGWSAGEEPNDGNGFGVDQEPSADPPRIINTRTGLGVSTGGNSPDVVVDPATGAMKADGRKPRTDLLPPLPLLDIAEVLEFGSRKYADRNWERGFAWGRPYGALLRHLLQWWAGEDLDEETGMSHLAHAGCDLLMLLEFTHTEAGTDDRPHQVHEENN